jgi:diphthine synthase
MLVLIGLGLHDEKDISLRGLEEARSSDMIFAELYTSRIEEGALGRLEELVEKKITVLERAEVEEKGQDVLIEPAKNEKVALLVAGDPLVSTTHVHLMIDAAKEGIETSIVHNTSIMSAIPVTGLSNYKFGRSTTIARPEPGFFPESPYDALKENRKLGLHTLMFLDIKGLKEADSMMTAGEAMDVLMKVEEKRREDIFNEDTLCVILGKAGSPDTVLRAGKVRDIRDMDFGPPPHTLIVPGELHFMEEEYLEVFAGYEGPSG